MLGAFAFRNLQKIFHELNLTGIESFTETDPPALRVTYNVANQPRGFLRRLN